LTSAGAAIALIAQAAETQFLEGRQQLEGEGVIGPVFVDNRLDLAFHVGAHLLDHGQFGGGQNIDELVEVAIRRRQRLRLLLFLDCEGHRFSPPCSFPDFWNDVRGEHG